MVAEPRLEKHRPEPQPFEEIQHLLKKQLAFIQRDHGQLTLDQVRLREDTRRALQNTVLVPLRVHLEEDSVIGREPVRHQFVQRCALNRF